MFVFSQGNPKFLECPYRPLQFEEELDILFIDNNATGKNAWAPMRDEPSRSEVPRGDEFHSGTSSDFIESLNTIVVSDSAVMVEELKEARKKKLKRSFEKTPTRSRNTIKGEIMQYVESFIKVTKSLIESRRVVTPAKGVM